MNINKIKTPSREHLFLFVIYFCVFIFCILSDPIYSHDTYSYLKAMPYRQLGYVIFLKTFVFIFGDYFDLAVVTVHALFTLIGVHYFYRKTVTLFSLNSIYKLVLIAILLFPFFPPLRIANNLVSEGLGYGLYLLFVALGCQILFNDKRELFKYYIIVYLGLVFIRSQFIFSTLIFAGVYFLLHRKSILQRKHLITIIIFFGIIAAASLTERTYHKLKDGFFKATPLGFVSAATAIVYVSDTTDYKYVEQKNYREILKISYDTLVKKDLLLKANETKKENYQFFHDNLPKICNQTLHIEAINYFIKHDVPPGLTEKQTASYPFFEAEAAYKVITFSLFTNNFRKWIQLYYTNITHGFYSPLLFLFVVLRVFFSLIKTKVTLNKHHAIIFLLASLILSNALFIAFASHSIMRYLFYNYALIFLLFISTLKLLKRE